MKGLKGFLILLLTIACIQWQWASAASDDLIVHSYYHQDQVAKNSSSLHSLVGRGTPQVIDKAIEAHQPRIFPSSNMISVIEKWQSPEPAKNYHIGVLFPHLQDSYWTAAHYGMVTHARQLGVRLTLLEAGGYIKFGNQRYLISELEKKTDGIILSTVEYKNMDRFIESASVPVVGLINDIHTSAVKAKAMVSYFNAGFKAGEYVLDDADGKDIKIAFFSGPEKSKWSKDMYQGFLAALERFKPPEQQVEVLPATYGDTRPDVQRMRLSYIFRQQNNQDVDYIVGNAVAAQEAVHFIGQQSLGLKPDLKIVSTYLTADLYDYIKRGDIKAAPYDQTLMLSRIALDMMVRQLNGETAGVDFPLLAGPDYLLITEKNIAQYSYQALFGPRDYRPKVDTLQ